MSYIGKNIVVLAVIEIVMVFLITIVSQTLFPSDTVSLFTTIGLAVVFFLMDGLTLVLSNKMLHKQFKHMVGFYLVAKVLRFMISVAVIFLYLIAGGDHAMMFVIQLLLFYLVTLLFTNASLVKSEAINKRKYEKIKIFITLHCSLMFFFSKWLC